MRRPRSRPACRPAPKGRRTCRAARPPIAAPAARPRSALGATLVAAINATEEGRTKSGRRLHASSSGSAAARLGIPVGATAQKIVDSFAAFLTQPGTVAVMKQSGVLPNATRVGRRGAAAHFGAAQQLRAPTGRLVHLHICACRRPAAGGAALISSCAFLRPASAAAVQAPEGRAKLCHDANRTSMSAAVRCRRCRDAGAGGGGRRACWRRQAGARCALAWR